MKKRLAIIMAVLALMLMIAGCGKSGTGDDSQKKDNSKYTLVSEIAEDGKSMSIEAYRADEGDFTMSGALIVGENEKVTSYPAMNEGYITIELIGSDDMGLDGESGAEDIENAGQAGAAYTIKAEAVNTTEVTPEPGEYYVRVTTGKGADGVVTLSVTPSE